MFDAKSDTGIRCFYFSKIANVRFELPAFTGTENVAFGISSKPRICWYGSIRHSPCLCGCAYWHQPVHVHGDVRFMPEAVQKREAVSVLSKSLGIEGYLVFNVVRDLPVVKITYSQLGRNCTAGRSVDILNAVCGNLEASKGSTTIAKTFEISFSLRAVVELAVTCS